MPVYEYRCKDCGRTHEIEHGFNDERPTKCPSCAGHLVRVFHPVGVVFKGSGFHKTDYTSSGLRKGAGGSDAGTDGSKGDGKAAESKAADGKVPAKTESKPSSDAKPAASAGDAKPSSSNTTS
jgi:putative FmdB family regulatory protein